MTVTFPDDYGAEHLREKTAAFAVTVKAVRAPATPEVDDALAEKVGFESLEKLREALTTKIERDFAAQTRHRVKRRLLDVLDEKHTFELPERMVEAEFDQIWTHVKADLDAGRLGEDDKDKSEDELRTEYRAIAERRVRLGLVLAEIGRTNAIEVGQEEIARAVAAEARRYPGREGDVARYYQENAQARDQLRAPIYEEKVVDFILELADVTDAPVSKDDLFADED